MRERSSGTGGLWLPEPRLRPRAWLEGDPKASSPRYKVLGVPPTGRLGPAIAFFAYEAPKVLLLLVAVVFVIES